MLNKWWLFGGAIYMLLMCLAPYTDASFLAGAFVLYFIGMSVK